MRTTLDIEKPVLDDLKVLQKREKKPLGQIASALLAQALKEQMLAQHQTADATKLDWVTSSMGARVDLSDKDAVYRILDEA